MSRYQTGFVLGIFVVRFVLLGFVLVGFGVVREWSQWVPWELGYIQVFKM